MTFSSVCWALAPSTPPWATMTPITRSYHLVIKWCKQFLSHKRAQEALHSLGGALAEQFSWSVPLVRSTLISFKLLLCRNYDHVASQWQQEQWIPQSAVAQARAHYAAYSVQRTDGLRIITLNTDLCKRLFAKLYQSDMIIDPGYTYALPYARVLGNSNGSTARTCLTTSISPKPTIRG